MIPDSSYVEAALYPQEDFMLILFEEVIPECNIHDRMCVYTWTGLMDSTEVLWARNETM